MHVNKKTTLGVIHILQKKNRLSQIQAVSCADQKVMLRFMGSQRVGHS